MKSVKIAKIVYTFGSVHLFDGVLELRFAHTHTLPRRPNCAVGRVSGNTLTTYTILLFLLGLAHLNFCVKVENKDTI